MGERDREREVHALRMNALRMLCEEACNGTHRVDADLGPAGLRQNVIVEVPILRFASLNYHICYHSIDDFMIINVI